MAGLSSEEASLRLKKYGLNTIPERENRYFLTFLKKFSAPIPWMLEGIIILEIFLKKPTEATIIACLLLFNVILSFMQEEKAKKALRFLQKRLTVMARVLRGKEWKLLPAGELVPGDYIRVRMGDIIPADIKLSEGFLLIDQSVLTGESLPIEAKSGTIGYAGAVVTNGEAFAEVIATGTNSYYGKAAEIVALAKTPSHLQRMIFQIIKYLVIFDAFLVLAAFVSSFYFQLPLLELLPFTLLLFVASVPVALPAMFTLATALGSLELAKAGVLVARLSAIEEAAGMSILCVDKTGTITKNLLEVSGVQAYPPYSEKEVLDFAVLASEEATQDPIDLAILKKWKGNTISLNRLEFIPFDPEKKYATAIVTDGKKTLKICKGAPSALLDKAFSEDLENLGNDGSRVLCITIDDEIAGVLKIVDPLRDNSSAVIQEIQALGIQVIMLTGDSITTAKATAEKAGIGSHVANREELDHILSVNAIAGVFPEDKFHIIKNLQKENYICGMTGDGVNDAPALKIAEVGIAVANATDVAKASASLILTTPGLQNILDAIKTSRKIYQRMLTYTLNKIVKTLQICVLLSMGLILERNFIISQILIVLFLFANDFMTMSIATDRVTYSRNPDKWNIKKLMLTGGIFAVLILAFSFAILFIASRLFDMPHLQTVVFLLLVFTGQTTVYLIRERQKPFWHSKPSFWMLASSIVDISIVSILAIKGVLMASISAPIVFGLLGIVIFYFLLLDFVKMQLFEKKEKL